MKTQITNIRDENIPDTNIKRIMSEYYQQLYTNTFDIFKCPNGGLSEWPNPFFSTCAWYHTEVLGKQEGKCGPQSVQTLGPRGLA